MNWIVALFVGLLVGWLIEWIIDWWYWRRRGENSAQKYQEELKTAQNTIVQLRSQPREDSPNDSESQQNNVHLKAQLRESAILNGKFQQAIAQLKSQLKENADQNKKYLQTIALLKTQLNESIVFKKRSLKTIVSLQTQLKECAEQKKRTLQDIRGIGPVIEGKLNDAGVHTFEDLAQLTSERLEEIVGKRIRNLVDEDSLIRQAKEVPPEMP